VWQEVSFMRAVYRGCPAAAAGMRAAHGCPQKLSLVLVRGRSYDGPLSFQQASRNHGHQLERTGIHRRH
jgi:hypothetical protein